MRYVENKAGGSHGWARRGCFLFALGRKGHVMPASKEVQFIPGTLTVAEEDEIAEHIFIVGLSPGPKGNLLGIGDMRRTSQILSHFVSTFLYHRLVSLVEPLILKTPHPYPAFCRNQVQETYPHGKSSRNRPRNHQLSRCSS